MIRKTRIKQVIPCTENIRMCFWDNEEKSIMKNKVRFLATINSDGVECLSPLQETCGGFFVPAVEMDDYLGLEMDDIEQDDIFQDRIEAVKRKIERMKD